MRFTCTAALVILTLSHLEVAASDAACSSLSEDGGLPHGGEEIIYEQKSFYIQSKNYPISVFSDTKEINGASEHCLRYEIENTGKEEIQNLFWETAGIGLESFRPGEVNRESRTKKVRSYKKPYKDKDHIHSFANETIDPYTWLLDARQASSRDKADNYLDFQYVLLSSIDPDLPGTLASFGYSNKNVLAANYEEKDVTVYPTSEIINGNGFEIFVNSNVETGDGVANFYTDIQIRYDGEGSAEITAPAVFAWSSLYENGIEKSYNNYLKVLSSAINEKNTIESGGIGNFKYFFQNVLSDNNKIFLVKNPIYLNINGNNRCYVVQAYSPFAVDVDLFKCMSWKN